MDILRLLPDDQYQAALAASSPSATNAFATVNDLAGLGDNFANADLTVSGARTHDLAGNTVTFDDGTTTTLLTQAAGTVQSGTGFSPSGFGVLGNATRIAPTGSQYDMWNAHWIFGGNPVYSNYIYDNTTFTEQSGLYINTQLYGPNLRPYTGLYYTSDNVNFRGIEANVNGTRILDYSGVLVVRVILEHLIKMDSFLGWEHNGQQFLQHKI
jgi:hypothetical protein